MFAGKVGEGKRMMEIHNIKCMDYMRSIPSNHFDIAVVDPPYGHGKSSIKTGNTKSRMATSAHLKAYDNSAPPSREYFKELKRVSKNQIIWGANHFAGLFDSSSQGWIVWNKHMKGDMSDCELAYTSFDRASKLFDYVWCGIHQGTN